MREATESDNAPADLPDMAGSRLVLDDLTIRLDRVLRRHLDSSLTFIARDGDAAYVARVFLHKPPSQSQLEKLVNARGVIRYDSIGDAAIWSHEDSSKRSRWATVRPYTQRTLSEFVSPRPGLLGHGKLPGIAVLTDIACGLEALHMHGIVHGDLRPSNVLIDGNRGAQIVDYGVSASMARTNVPDALVPFIAPEELTYGASPHERGDVYSFGKLARVVMKAADAMHRQDREMLSWLAAECLRLAAADRPVMRQVREFLQSAGGAPNELLNVEYGSLRQAVIADIDSRVPDLFADQPLLVAAAATAATQQAEGDTRRYSVYRAAALGIPELTHLLSTLAISLIDRSTVSTYALSQKYVNVVKLEHDYSYPPYLLYSGDSTRDSLPSDFLDPDWSTEIWNLATHNAPSDIVSDELRARAEAQLRYAFDLRRNILDSDIFARSEDVAAIMSRACPGITVDEVRILRDMGYLLSLPDDGRNVYPLFQFEARSGLPYKCIKEVFDIQGDQGSTWKRAAWWFIADPRLDYKSPMEWLREDRDQRAIAAAFSLDAAA